MLSKTKTDLLLPTDSTMVSAATFAGAYRPAGWRFLVVVAAVAETVSAKALETEAVVWWQRKQRECLRSGYIGDGQWNQRGSGDGRKISAGGSGGGGGGGGGRNRGSGFGGGDSGDGVGRQQQQRQGRQ